MDPMTIAQHLTLLESRLYVQIRHQECLNWAKTQTGPTVANLTRFCATHEKLASWVKLSVLNNDALGKRADTVDFWIKVAEVRRQHCLFVIAFFRLWLLTDHSYFFSK
jgi:son of sevenless